MLDARTAERSRPRPVPAGVTIAKPRIAMIEWKPIAKETLLGRIAQGEARMTAAQRQLWQAMRIEPEKWQQHPFGDPGEGFWVSAIIGRSVIWYNDREEGFNRSQYSVHGTFDDYWCNDDELELTVQYLMNAMTQGTDLVGLRSRPARVPR
jgi:hypothetical protein